MFCGCRVTLEDVLQRDDEIIGRYHVVGLVVVGQTNLLKMSCNIATESKLHRSMRNRGTSTAVFVAYPAVLR